MRLLLLFIIVLSAFVSCGDDKGNTNETDKCKDVTCDEWKQCNSLNGNCETKENRCSNNGECSGSQICGNNHNCIERSNKFITTWKIDSFSNNKQVKIPIITAEADSFNNEVYDYNVDCDSDGVFEAEHQSEEYICNYNSLGTYTITITGQFPRTYFYYTDRDNSKKLIAIEQWGTQKWSSMNQAFAYCNNLKDINAPDTPDLSMVTDMSYMFSDNWYFNAEIGNWDVSNITNMTSMFNGAEMFNADLSDWDVSGVTDMSFMFSDAESFNGNVTNWNVSAVTDMHAMFQLAVSFNQNISSWNVSKVKDMTTMFANATSFNQDLSSWDVDQVMNCLQFDYSISAWTLPKPNFTSCNP